MKFITVLAIFLCSHSFAETLKILNWSDYIDEDFVTMFSEKYDVDIDYATYEDINDFDFNFFLEDQDFDVVFPPLDALQTMIERNMAQPLVKKDLTNLKNMDSAQLKRLATYDPGNKYALPYLWGTTGIGVNVDKVKDALGVEEVPESWKLIFDPEYAQALSTCGISWLDSEIEMLPLSLNYIGMDPSSSSRSDFRATEEHLRKVSPFVSTFTSEEYIEPFRDGNVCIAVGYSGDIFQAIWEAEELDNGQTLRYIIPEEGAFVWFDPVVITSKTNSKLAHAFVNELMDPQNIAAITNYVWYANAVEKSLPFVDDEIKNDTSIYPNSTVSQKLFGYPVYEDSTLRTMKRRWTKVKCSAGQECLVPIDAIPN